MIEGDDRFDSLISRPTREALEKLSEPALPVLAKFVHGCSQDPNERTIAVTLLVTSLCQLVGRGVMHRMPSTIVVSGHDLNPDPADMLADWLVANPPGPDEKLCKHRLFLGGRPEGAPGAMAAAINARQELGNVTPRNVAEHEIHTQRYFVAQYFAFGHGPSRRYAKAWHDVFGLLTDRGDELILRLDSPEDRATFRKDVIEGARRLREPVGYGSDLTLVQKNIAISGSLAASAWDAPLANAFLELGLPLLFLPSLAREAPVISNDTVLQFVASCLPGSFTTPVEEPANLVPSPWFEGYGRELRARLRHLPADYEYSLQKLARQLFPACLRIASWCGHYSGSSDEEITAMTHDLCEHSLRGLVLSVAGLAWHGLGIDAGCSHQEFLRVLDYLRRKGPMSKSDLLRGAHLQKQDRNRLVACFEAEGLARVDGKSIRATSYVDFVESLYSREEFPFPVNHWSKVTGKRDAA